MDYLQWFKDSKLTVADYWNATSVWDETYWQDREVMVVRDGHLDNGVRIHVVSGTILLEPVMWSNAVIITESMYKTFMGVK